MSIFGKIMGAIFGTKADAATPAGTTGAGSTAPSSPTGATVVVIDVAPILDKAVAAKNEKLEWRTSIVDLMKALDIDFEPGCAQRAGKRAQLFRRHK